MREEIFVLNPQSGKNKQIAGKAIIVVGLLLLFIFPPIGILVALLGGAVNAIGKAQHWYNWK